MIEIKKKEKIENIQYVLSSSSRKKFIKSIPGLILIAPTIIYLIIFNYIPMFGIIIAFKDFNYQKGILGSKWVGFENFRFFFTSQDAVRITRNTVGYSVLFICTGMLVSIIIALLLYELKSKRALKVYQTSIILPHFLSWVVVAYMSYILLNPSIGLINQMLTSLGLKEVNWYSEPNKWIAIFPIANIWKNVGMGCIIYYAALMGIDTSMYEAARIDGASRWKQTLYISIPELIPIMSIMLIMQVGNVMRGDFGLFYQLPMDVGSLYSTTDIIDTYVYRGLKQGNIGISSAVGFFQSGVGLIMVLITNAIVKKINPENSMF